MNKITFLLIFFSATIVFAQSSWKKINSENHLSKNELEFRKTTPSTLDLYALNIESLKNEIHLSKTISIPINGEFSKFNIKEVSSFTKPLASKYGYIKSFSLKGIDDKTATGKISIGTDGIHMVIFSGKHATTYIDPYTKDKSTYITYKRDQIDNNRNDFKCLIETNTNAAKKSSVSITQTNADDGILRTYKLALACTGEYAQFHINNAGVSSASDSEKKAAILSAMNTTMTRVNGIFERDLATTMTIVVNSSGENELIFLNPTTDNLSNNDANILIDESQNICDAIIGSANYDIGHTFSTGAGGLAGLGVLCSSGQKGQGVTGRNSPIGDAFDIDYVAHEIGHQFGASHTFNNSCSNNRSNSTAVEPGSGTTIMGYAGICSPNIQNNGDDYFHAVSIAQMWNVVKNTSCATETNTNNTAPTVNAGINVSVPKATPLILTGEATDTNSGSLTYCWEQTDTEITTMPPLASNTAGPAFRSLPPSDDPDRYLPSLPTVISGSTETDWEVIPSVARELNFSLLVRDNNANGGASERDDIIITVVDTDPFLVTTPNTAVTWDVGTTQAITWNTSTTNQAPINCQNVKIMLSTDGGETFTTTLIESTPNDGSYDLIVPNQPTTSARIMILGVGNIFYNVNATNFSIVSTGPTFLLSNESESQKTFNQSTSSVTYKIAVNFINGFSETVTFSTENLPQGTNAILSTTSVNSSSEITLTITDFSNAMTGDYTIKLNGSSTSLNSVLELPNLTVNTNNVFGNFSLFPNPVEDFLTLSFDIPDSEEKVNLSLYDFTGKTIQSLTVESDTDTNIFNQNLNLNYLQSGIYLLKITNGILHTTKKIIVK